MNLLIAQSCPILCDFTDWRLQPSRLLSPWNSPGKNSGVGSHSILQGLEYIDVPCFFYDCSVSQNKELPYLIYPSSNQRLSAMQEIRVQSLGWEDPLEKEIAPYSSTLAWKIPWAKEPGRLRSMGSQRVGPDRATSLSLSFLQLNEAFQHVAFANHSVMNIVLKCFNVLFLNYAD